MRNTSRSMSQELNAEASSSTGRPLPDRLLVRVPFLADLVAVATLKLTPGGSLRQRLIMRALNTAWAGVNRGDFEPALLAYEPDAEVFLIGAPGVGLAESYSGRGGWTDFMADIFDNFGEPTFSVRRVRDGGDRVAAELTLTAAGKVSGAQVERTTSSVYYFSGRGKIARQDVYWQPDGWNLALEAAGISE